MGRFKTLSVVNDRTTLDVRFAEPEGIARGVVVLGNAMFNSNEYWMKPVGKSFADFLVNSGYVVVTFNYTGYGKSSRGNRGTNFDTYVADHGQVFSRVAESWPKLLLFYIGHSVGGLAGLSELSISSRQYAGILLLAPAVWGFSEQNAKGQRVRIRLAQMFSNPTGVLPTRWLKLGDTNAPHGYFDQFLGWLRADRVTSRDGETDYADAWRNAQNVTVLSGKADLKMAPPGNVAWVQSKLPSNAQVIEVAASSEFGFDADHFSLIYGKRAAETVWPFVLRTLEGESK